MKPASTAGLRIGSDSCLLELVMEPQRCLPNVGERRRIAGVQIKNGLIGLHEVRDMGTPEVKFDGPLVGEPDQASYSVDQRQRNQVRGRLGTVLDPAEPVGSRVRYAPEVEGSLRLFGNRYTSDERHPALKQLDGKREEHPLEFARLAHSFEKLEKTSSRLALIAILYVRHRFKNWHGFNR